MDAKTFDLIVDLANEGMDGQTSKVEDLILEIAKRLEKTHPKRSERMNNVVNPIEDFSVCPSREQELRRLQRSWKEYVHKEKFTHLYATSFGASDASLGID